MRRIGFVLSTTKPGGVEMAVLRTLEQLDRSRFLPFVVVTGEHGSLRSRFESLARLDGHIATEYINNDATLHVIIPDLDVLNIYNNLAWAAAFWDQSAFAKVDVIQHCYMHPQTLFWHHARDKSYYRLLYNFFAHKYVVCDSPATADAIVQDATLWANTHPEDFPAARKRDGRGIQARVKVIRHDVGDRAAAAAPVPRLHGRVLWVGSPTWVKGFDRLAHIVDAEVNDNVNFEIVCKTPPAEPLDLQGTWRRCRVHVGLSQQQLAKLRGQCQSYLSTSRREGRSVAWEEAKADGLVCIDAGGPPEPAETTAVDDLALLWEEE